jgi:hypothetical protein
MQPLATTYGSENGREMFKLECQESLWGRFTGNIGKGICGINGNAGQMKLIQQMINTFFYGNENRYLRTGFSYMKERISS